jgi:hypothetical protein
VILDYNDSVVIVFFLHLQPLVAEVVLVMVHLLAVFTMVQYLQPVDQVEVVLDL